MRRYLFVLFAALAVAVAARQGAAQNLLPQSIQFHGAPGYSDEELLAATDLHEGAILTSDQMNASAKRLMKSGIFEQVGYKFDGRDLVFTVALSTDLLPVRIENLPLTPGDELNAELHSQFPLFHGKVPSEGQLLDDVRGALEQKLAEEGLKVKVTAQPYADKKQSRKVTAMNFSIEALPVRLGPIRIEGASPSLLPRVQASAMLAARMPFESDGTWQGLEQRIVSFYADQGYAAVKVHATQSGTPVMTEDAIDVPCTIEVNEGTIYKTTSIVIPKNSLIGQDEVDRVISSKQATLGEVASLVERRYRSHGYLDVVVTPKPAFDESAGTVQYTIEITPGEIYHLGFVKFDNVSDQVRNLLIRYWQMMPGDIFDESYLDLFLEKAESQDAGLRRALSGMASEVETDADPVTHSVDVIFTLQKPDLSTPMEK